MRYREIIQVPESFGDETKSPEAKGLDAETYLETGEYADEQADLLRVYTIDDPELVDMVRDYTRASTINAALRKGRELGRVLAPQHAALMSLGDLDKALPERHHVYSGIGTADLGDLEVGSHYTTDAFTSASLSIEVAVKTNNFHRENRHGTSDSLLHLILPKGYRGCFYIGPFSTAPAELEMLIYPQEEFRLVKKSVLDLDGGISRTILTMVPVKNSTVS